MTFDRRNTNAWRPKMTQQIVEDRKMTRQEAAEYLRVSVQLLAEDVCTKRYKVPFTKIGRRCIYSRDQLDQWMRANSTNLASA